MAHVSDFTFYGLSRIGDDNCSIDQRTIQNTNSCNYLLDNFYTSDCNMRGVVNLATSQPCINYKGGMGSDFCGSNIDTNSRLLIGSVQTNPRCRIDLFQRPFATVPYLGRGSVDPILESELMQGQQNSDRKTETNLSERSYIKYQTIPLIPEVKKNIQNPERLIESMASESWIRGGLPSREIIRDTKSYH
jgi:hypothetical protein